MTAEPAPRTTDAATAVRKMRRVQASLQAGQGLGENMSPRAFAALIGECADTLAACAERNEKLGERDAWLTRQLDGCLEAAEAVAHATGLATARALLGDIRDARAALAEAAPEREPA